MKHIARPLIAALLCLCICLGMAAPALAANSKGITFTATLDKSTFTVSRNPQTVTMDILASAPVAVDGIGGTVTCDPALELNSISNTEEAINIVAGENGKFGWYASDAEDVEGVENIVRATFTIPANTPAGSYTVGVTGLELTENYGTVWENSASVTATITITEPVVAEGYTVAMSTLTPSPVHGSTFDVTVDITNSDAEQTHFAAGQFEITYDNTALALNTITANLPGGNLTTNAVVSGNTTTLKIADFGTDKMLGNGIYTLSFTAATPGDTTLTLDSAGFTTKENAITQDLEVATCGEDLIVEVLPKTFTVTLPEYGFSTDGSLNVTDGHPFTFTIADPYYDYGIVYYAMDGGEPVALEPSAEGVYVIPAVTGDVVITTEKTEARSYNVSFVGEVESGENTATYMTDYQFTLLPNKDPDLTEGYNYSVKSVTIGGEEYHNYTAAEDRTYTIPGADIKGDIVVTVEKTMVQRTEVNVTASGHIGSIVGFQSTAPYGTDYTLTLDEISGYIYTVTATLGNGESAVAATVENVGEGKYQVKNVTDDLHFVIARSVNTDGVSLHHYLTLNGNNMYLVLESAEAIGLDAEHIPTYDSTPMYWSERYKAYCYLVIAKTLSLDEAKAKIERVQLSDTVTKVDVVYNMDINMTGTVDAADAQLAYHMYSNPTITAFTTELPMMKFLKADVAGEDKIVNTNDAVAIVNAILGITAQ